jgi:predicted nucleic acid-binding protein
MPFLFDTDAISEVLRKKPAPAYLRWLAEIPQAEQFTSAVAVGELFRGAFRSKEPKRHLENIETRVLLALTVLPFDVPIARIYGEIQAQLAGMGKILEDADLQIAATAIHHGLEMVTGNLQHFERIPGLRLQRVFAESRLGPGGSAAAPRSTPGP